MTYTILDHVEQLKRAEAHKADEQKAEAEKAKALMDEHNARVFADALLFVPQWLRGFFAPDESYVDGHYACLRFSFPSDLVQMAPIQIRVSTYENNTGIKQMFYAEARCYDEGPFYSSPDYSAHTINELILAASNAGDEFKRKQADWEEKQSANAAIKAAQQAAEPALDRARAAQRAYNEHLLAVIESDPVLNSLLNILFAISDERAANRSALSAAEWWANEGHSNSEEQERRNRAKIDELARELREAQDEARRADDEVSALKRKLGRS